MNQNYTYFIYGLCCMFYSMMAWFFWRKRGERLSSLVMVLMVIIALQCVKDLFFLSYPVFESRELWVMMTAPDMLAVPFYVFILTELCCPGKLSLRPAVLQLLPFILLPVLFIATRIEAFYIIEVVWAAIYGLGYAIWTMFAIGRYNRLLKQRFSYEDNINLDWLKSILVFFFAMLSLWIVDCMYINLNIERIYLLGSMAMWMFLCYFIYRHESVIGELGLPSNEKPGTPEEESAISIRIRSLFDEQQVFLNPNIKLSDIAAMVGSNRTYVSRFFNDEQKTTFFDFVNSYRINYAKNLLRTSDEKMDVIAEKSGFNSRQSFHRVFSKITGCTPDQFRSRDN